MEDTSHLGGCILTGEYGDERTYTPALWEYLLKITGAKSVLDIGCGGGFALKWFLDRGLTVLGIEAFPIALEAMRRKGLRQFCAELDFTKDSSDAIARPNGELWDLGWCSEVAEHIDERYVDNLIGAFRKCRFVAMTHALPGQDGHHHVNCQPPEYWLDKMMKAGFIPMTDETLTARAIVEENPFRGTFTRLSLLLFVNGA